MSRGNVELTHVGHDAHAVRYGRLLVGGDPFGYWALRMTVFHRRSTRRDLSLCHLAE